MNNDWTPGDLCIIIRGIFSENLGKQVTLVEFIPAGTRYVEPINKTVFTASVDRWVVHCEAGIRVARTWRNKDGSGGYEEAVVPLFAGIKENLMKIGDANPANVQTTEKSKDLEAV